jgi:hypothetical protein
MLLIMDEKLLFRLTSCALSSSFKCIVPLPVMLLWLEVWHWTRLHVNVANVLPLLRCNR